MNWDDEEETLWQRHRWLLPVMIVSVGGGVAYAFTQVKTDEAPPPPRQPERMIMIAPPPPPPKPLPPPPPKPPEPKQHEEQKEEMVEQPKMEEPEEKPAPPDEPPPSLGTGIKGDGTPDGFGLGTKGNGMIGGTGNGGGRKTGSAFGWYAAQVQSSIADAVRRNGKTKFASGQRDVRIWVDSTGRITRAAISGGGESEVNAALNNEVLTGLQLREAPPSNMPMPIVLRISAQRPN